jgi:hypothetical protein
MQRNLLESKLLIRKYEKILKNFSDIFNNVKQKEKFKYLYGLRSSGITQSQCLKLGFRVTSYLWRNCLNPEERSKGKLPLFYY